MSKTKFTKNDKNRLSNISNPKFLFIENLSDFEKIKDLSNYELCIVKTDFKTSNLKIIEEYRLANKDVEFWIASNESSRDNILLANSIGIKNVIPHPVDMSIVKDFFNQKDISYMTNKLTPKTNYSSIEGLKVMIVDDNLMNVQLLEEVLEQFDLDISSFTKPIDALEVMAKEKFDLFLLDIMMPEMSGFDLAKKIKTSSYNQYTPIVFISALSDSQNKMTGYDLGSQIYIEKPFDLNLVKSQIYNILKNQKIQDVLTSSKEIFMATVVHDLKTPIRAKINALNLLLSENFGTLETNQQEIIEDILNSAKFTQDMVENLLCKGKIDCGKINLLKQVYSLKALALHCIDLTKYILTEKKQTVNLKCNLDNTLVPLDFLEMKRAIHNLIANASEYSPKGQEIIIEVFKKGEKMGISVQDFGEGIALENQEDVFSQYMSLAKKNKTVGSGLGLYITKRIVEEHDGEIMLESKVGYGTKISIILPMYTKV